MPLSTCTIHSWTSNASQRVYTLWTTLPMTPSCHWLRKLCKSSTMLGYTCVCGGQVEVLVTEYDEPVDDLILYTTERQVGLSISFHGEKDCEYDIDKHHSSHFIGTVLLQLYAGAIARRLQPSDEKKHIHSIYIPVPSPFPSLEAFILKRKKTYNLDLFSYRSSLSQIDPRPTTPGDVVVAKAAGKIRPGEGMLHRLEIYKKRFPQVITILICTRWTNPHAGTFTPRLLLAIFIPMSVSLATLSHRNIAGPGHVFNAYTP